MLRSMLLIGAATIAVPAFAQDKPASDNTAPQQQAAPAQPAALTDPTAPDPAQDPTATQDDAASTSTPVAQAPTRQVTPPAQTATAPTTPAPTTAPAQTATTAPAPQTAPAAPATPQTATATSPAQPAAPAPAQTATAPAPAAAAAPAAKPAQPPQQVAMIVGKEYASYDADKSGGLNQAEFGKWMIALRTASDASFDGNSAAGKAWVSQAFGVADTDKNKAVSQSEMTALLGRSG